MSKIRNTPHVYTPPLKRVGIQWYPGNAEGFRWGRTGCAPSWRTATKPAPDAE